MLDVHFVPLKDWLESKDPGASGFLHVPAAFAAAVVGDLPNAVAASTPGGIEHQEAEGQRDLIRSTHLPKNIMGASRKQLEDLGFKFHEDVDNLFVSCELPTGWTKTATDHSMHSNLLDENGRCRALIFYKAAFYDRRAYMSMQSRFSIDGWVASDRPEQYNTAVFDGETQLFSSGTWSPDADAFYERKGRLYDLCEDWLNENYPDWKNPLAYW